MWSTMGLDVLHVGLTGRFVFLFRIISEILFVWLVRFAGCRIVVMMKTNWSRSIVEVERVHRSCVCDMLLCRSRIVPESKLKSCQVEVNMCQMRF